MSKTVIGDPILLADGSSVPLSKAVRFGDQVVVSGQLAFDDSGKVIEGGVDVQTRRVLENLQGVLEEAGCSLDDVVKCTCWLSSTDDFREFNRVYGEFFRLDPPARSTVVSTLMFDAKVEIEALAYKPLE